MRKFHNNGRIMWKHDLEDGLDEIKMYLKYSYDHTEYEV